MSNEMTLETEGECEGWVWVLTIQGMPDVHHSHELEDEEDYEDEFGGDIVGAYATKELMIADMNKMGANRYGMFHLKIDGWTPHKQIQT